MSIIYSYPEQGQLNADDMFIGTSAVTVGGKQKNITRNFTVQQIADFINQGAGFVDPLASDFQIPVFNQQGKKITGSIMSQNIYPNGSAITIAGELTVNTNLTASGNVTLGSGANNIILQSTTTLGGPIKDSSNTLGVSNQILISNSLGNLVWQNYEAGLTYEGTWDASTNTPALTSGQGVSGHFYIVNVAGNTNLDGNNDWHVGDWAVFFDAGGGGTAGWQKIDNTSVLTGSGTANTFAMWTATETLNDSLLSQDVGATKVIVDGLLEVKGDGASQDGRIKLNCSQNSHGVTIQSPPHSAGASYTLVLPTSVGTSGQALTTDGSDPAQLSWTTPTTGTVTGTGTQNYVTKWSTGGTGIENSTIFDNGTNVGIGTTSPGAKLEVAGGTDNLVAVFSSTDDVAQIQIVDNDTSTFLGSKDGLSYISQTAGTPQDGLVVDSSGNVGIGTTNPASPLHVNSGTGNRAATFTSSDPIVSLALIDSNALAQIQNSGGNLIFDADRDNERSDSYIGFEIDGGSEKMRIDSSGNVGIGTSSPADKLHVVGATKIEGTLFVESANNQIRIVDSDSSGSFSVGVNTHFQIRDIAGNTTPVTVQAGTPGGTLFLKSSGNIGIGTTSPAVSLDISATDAVQMPVGVTGDRPTTGVSNGMLRYNSTNNGFEGYINGNWGSIGGGASGGLIFRGTFDASTGTIAGGGNLTTGATRVAIAVGDMYIVDTAGDFYGDTSKPLNVGDEVICVLDAAVGTSDINDWNAIASGAGGAVTGSGTTNYIPKFTGATVVGNSSIFNDASGNVGIGTASPVRSLNVNSGSQQVTALIESTSSISSQINIKNSNSNNGGFIKTTGDNVILTANSTGQSHLVVANGGDVGIGTASPSARLHVEETSNVGISSVYATAIIESGDAQLDITSGPGGTWGSSLNFVEGGGSANIDIWSIARTTSTYNSDLRFNFGTNNQHTNSTKVTFTSGGNVGIGTDSPDVSLDLGNNTDAIRVPNGTTADRPSGILPGMIRYNNSTNEFEGYSGTLNVSGSWGALGGAPTITKQLFTVTTAQSIFTLTAGVNPQDANYVNIFIDGVYQNSGTYNVATATGTTTVNLNTAAPVGTSVEIISTT